MSLARQGVQLAEYHAHISPPHEPSSDPVPSVLPCRQAFVCLHQPQLDAKVHPPQPIAVMAVQSTGAGGAPGLHSLAIQRQFGATQLLSEDIVASPPTHWFVVAHHPQPGCNVHVSQLVCVLHGTAVPPSGSVPGV